MKAVMRYVCESEVIGIDEFDGIKITKHAHTSNQHNHFDTTVIDQIIFLDWCGITTEMFIEFFGCDHRVWFCPLPGSLEELFSVVGI